MVNLLEAWQGSKSSEQQLSQLKQEKVALQGQLRDASSPASLEREARRLGMVKAGEKSYVVQDLTREIARADIRSAP
jgi:cell division protein FtsB